MLRSFIIIAMMTYLPVISQAQVATKTSQSPGKVDRKPYKILTTGRQVTVKCTENIGSVMVWTSTGHRVLEQKSIGSPSFTFRVSVNEKVFFLMLRMQDGKHFTEKIGLN